MSTVTGYPTSGAGRFAMLINKTADLSDVTPAWERGYAPSQAEHGKFLRNDMSTISEYPTTGAGAFSILTFDVGAP